MTSGPWPSADKRLCALWADGLPKSRIAELLGVTLGAVNGRSHRLGLRRDRVTPAGVVIVPVRKPARARPVPPPRPVVAKAPPKPVERPVEPPAPVVEVVAAPVRTRPCCWPLGDPRNRATFRFCEAPTTLKTYCPPHYALSVVPAAPRRL